MSPKINKCLGSYGNITSLLMNIELTDLLICRVKIVVVLTNISLGIHPPIPRPIVTPLPQTLGSSSKMPHTPSKFP